MHISKNKSFEKKFKKGNRSFFLKSVYWWESWTWGPKSGRVDNATCLGSTLELTCPSPPSDIGEGKCPINPPPQLLANCSRQERREYWICTSLTAALGRAESGPCTMPGQNSRAGSGEMCVGEPAIRAWEQNSPASCCLLQWMDELVYGDGCSGGIGERSLADWST